MAQIVPTTPRYVLAPAMPAEQFNEACASRGLTGMDLRRWFHPATIAKLKDGEPVRVDIRRRLKYVLEAIPRDPDLDLSQL